MHAGSDSSFLTTPLKALWRWLMTAPGQTPFTTQGLAPTPSTAVARTTTLNLSPGRQPPSATTTRRDRVHKPLRMVRVMEAGQTSSQVGRMVISGRMADVCAELDRLAAFETPLH